jgi:hypothetical protein
MSLKIAMKLLSFFGIDDQKLLKFRQANMQTLAKFQISGSKVA